MKKLIVMIGMNVLKILVILIVPNMILVNIKMLSVTTVMHVRTIVVTLSLDVFILIIPTIVFLLISVMKLIVMNLRDV
jgi:hypothetical protein